MSVTEAVIFPIPLRDELADRHVERWRTYYECESDRDRTHEDGIWRRTQTAVNAPESKWLDAGDQRRRVVHYSHEYDLAQTARGSALVLKSTYIYYSVSLPDDELAARRSSIETALANAPWRRSSFGQDFEEWRLGDLCCRLERFRIHPEDIKAQRSLPGDYESLDVSLYSRPCPDVPRRLPWQVLANGMRLKDRRGSPTIVPNLASVAEHLPFHVELGCGASIEAGVPALHHLHDLYRVTDLETGHFVFGESRDDLMERLISRPAKELAMLTTLFQASFFAEPTQAHQALVALQQSGMLVGPVMTNNFDGLAHRAGLPELFLRRYDESVPPIVLHPEARSLLVIGSHADRRRVQARAREAGLKVFYLDPEGYDIDGQFISYPLESILDGDFLCRQGATSGLIELCSLLGLDERLWTSAL